MNSPVKILNPYHKPTMAYHRQKCVAAFIYERTRHGQRTTVRQVADAHGWDVRDVNQAVKRMQEQPTEINHNGKRLLVMVQPVKQETALNGVTAMTYAAILHHENVNQ